MYSTRNTCFLILLYLTSLVRLTQAGLYIIHPLQGSDCTAGQPCTITWLDDGTQPLVNAVGVSTVGVYANDMQLIQSISPVDVSTTQSVTFTPISGAGPNDGGYYIAITSTTLKNANGTAYTSWGPHFRLTGMSGSFDTPDAAATSPIPIPSSLTQSPSPYVTSTIIVGATSPATAVPPIATASTSASSNTSASSSGASASATSINPTSSRMSTSTLSSTSTSRSSSASASASTSTSGAPGRTGNSRSWTPAIITAAGFVWHWVL